MIQSLPVDIIPQDLWREKKKRKLILFIHSGSIYSCLTKTGKSAEFLHIHKNTLTVHLLSSTYPIQSQGRELERISAVMGQKDGYTTGRLPVFCMANREPKNHSNRPSV